MKGKGTFSYRLAELIWVLRYKNALVFSKKIGIKHGSVTRYLRGDGEPGLYMMQQIKKNIPEINLNWLISGEGRTFL